MRSRPPRRRGGTRRLAALLLVWLLLPAAGCGGGSAGPAEEAGTIDRSTFVATYVDLRLTALQTESGVITPSDRQRILESHGVTEEDLLGFVDVYAERVEYMREVWNDVDERIRQAATAGDTTAS